MLHLGPSTFRGAMDVSKPLRPSASCSAVRAWFGLLSLLHILTSAQAAVVHALSVDASGRLLRSWDQDYSTIADVV